MAEAYGEAGRQAYIHARFTFDVAWPLVYTFFLVTAMSWLFQRGFPPESPWQLANLVPLLAALFDFLENMTTSWVMARFPEPAPLAGILASLATPLKWTLVGGSVLLLFVGIAAAVMGRGEAKTIINQIYLFSSTPTTCSQGGSLKALRSMRMPSLRITPIEAALSSSVSAITRRRRSVPKA